MSKQLTLVDHAAIKTGQTLTMLLLLSAFVFDSWQLVAAVATINILGALRPAWSLFPATLSARLTALAFAKTAVTLRPS